MIKYVEFDAFDEYGQHITPVDAVCSMNKTASGGYSPELMKVILAMKRRDDRYYVVINALGSHEVWGSNKNGDGFPEVGLSHKSLRTDMSTSDDYGYKTFEYYAKFFKHHVNKDPKKSFGEVVFSHWNPILHRIELIVAINVISGKDIIDALSNGKQVAVSMGCLTDPEYPILTYSGYKPIKDINVGDTVMTHNGNWKKVTELHHNKYCGMLYKLKVRGLPLPLELTEDHPMMAKVFGRNTNGKKRPYIDNEAFNKVDFDWSEASNIEPGDHIKYQPTVYNDSSIIKVGDEDLAKLMGYYLAEGSFGFNNDNPCAIQLSCNSDDDLLQEVPKIVNKMFDGNVTCKIRPHRVSNKCFSVDIFSTEVAKFLMKYVGRGCRNKFIPAEVFVSDDNIKLAYIGAWLSGDGWCDKKGVHISSCNIGLLLSGRDLLISLGIPSSIYKITHKAGNGFSYHDTVEYTLNIGHLDAKLLIKYAPSKLLKLEEIISDRKKDGNSAIRSNDDNSMSYSVSSVEKRYTDGIPIYNFEVEGDESYVAAGLVSHNCKVKFDRCSVCGNKAKTRAQYCKHLKNHMRQIITRELADQWSRELGITILPGTQVFAFNDYPRFFDISKVHIGADRTAFILGKAASDGITIASVDIAEAYGMTDELFDKIAVVGKHGEMDKNIGGPPNDSEIDGRVTPTSKTIALKKIIDESMNKTLDVEPNLSNDLIDSIVSSNALSLSSVFSTLLGLGIHPKPSEFQRIILVRIGQKPLADQLEKDNLIFNYKDNDVEPINLDISNKNFSDTLGRLLIPFLQSRSAMPDFLEPRINSTIVKIAAEEWLDPEFDPNKKEIKISPELATITGLAALYAGLKAHAAGYSFKNIADLWTNKPWLRALIGGSVVSKLLSEAGKSDANELLLRPASDYENILQDTNFSGHLLKTGSDIEKSATASFQSAAGYGLIAGALTLPAAYITNAYNRKSLYTTGKPLFPGAGVKPTTAALGVGAATALGSNLSIKGLDFVRKGLSKIK